MKIHDFDTLLSAYLIEQNSFTSRKYKKTHACLLFLILQFAWPYGPHLTQGALIIYPGYTLPYFKGSFHMMLNYKLKHPEAKTPSATLTHLHLHSAKVDQAYTH